MKEHMIKVDQETLIELEEYLGKLLYNPDGKVFIIIKHIGSTEKIVTKKHWLTRKETIFTEYYITSGTIMVFHNSKWKMYSDRGLNLFFGVYYVSPAILRRYYINNIKSPLVSLGVDFNPSKVDE